MLKKLFNKYTNVIAYLFFGVCTTGVNVIAYWVVAHPLKQTVMVSTVIAWVLAVLFAYITNRKWVFISEAHSRTDKIKELFSFFACRLATGVVDWGCMWLFVDILLINDVVIKMAANILVIILNYIASKLIIFRKGKKRNEAED